MPQASVQSQHLQQNCPSAMKLISPHCMKCNTHLRDEGTGPYWHAASLCQKSQLVRPRSGQSFTICMYSYARSLRVSKEEALPSLLLTVSQYAS